MGRDRKCKFRKQNGDSCCADPQSGKDLCVFHDPAHANDGRRARRAGGLNRTHTAAVLAPDTPDHALGSTKDVCALLGDSINRLRHGELDPRVANAIGYLASVLLRALEQGPVEERLAHLEATLRKSNAETKSNADDQIFSFRSKTEVLNEQPS
jgi:hypothetical protein